MNGTENKMSLVQKLNKTRRRAERTKVFSEALGLTTCLFTPMAVGLCAGEDYSALQILANMGIVLAVGLGLAAVCGCVWFASCYIIHRTETEYAEYIRICREFFGRR